LNEIALYVDNIFKKYGSHIIFKNFSYHFELGIHVVSGKNGQGKTTLLKILSGAENFDTGNIVFDGKNLQKNSVAFKKNISYVPDKLMIYPFLTGQELLSMVAKIKLGISDIKNDININNLIERLNLRDYLHKKLGEMSLGNQKKSMIVAGLLSDTNIIIMDEPTNGLDELSRNFLIDYFIKNKLKKIIIISSHDKEFIKQLDANIISL
jgi:ABC-type multidrug transport system ATPase subunit